ncbi:hypothetical protein [Kushneria phosphatilytica]|uniref:Uncharacterized protein n=1 Tax=Kushneria phosphatilytica TaxID=657387 RepID=A0A1S1NX39_9GAMM|nr:hypothetical protein [Kushneria phosphatilytica]OHV12130.1 hypothetical protein BH688_05615 [Kushneria phosphatilytica]QEL11326.1 hypothetical protein FY550_09370 [Kushneria phosphatilytica]
MDNAKIVTNNVPRPIILGLGLSEKQMAEFDYIEDVYDARFFEYKGEIYDLGDAEAITEKERPNLYSKGWEGIYGENYFSAVLVKYYHDPISGIDTDYVIVGKVFS